MTFLPRFVAGGIGAALFAFGTPLLQAQTFTTGTPSDVVAKVGSTAITLGQVDERALKKIGRAHV